MQRTQVRNRRTRTWPTSSTHAAAIVCLLASCSIVETALAQWPQWGGPRRDFSCQATDLADRWPADGPHKVWSREIGGGHSAIIVDGATLYTMCRRENQDAVLAIDTNTGRTIWETRYDAPTKPDMQLDFGCGPHATPLLAGDRLFTIGAMVQFRCLDKKTGKTLWSHDLIDEMGASHLGRGYGASPIAYKDLVIINIGSRDTGIAAFKQDTGEMAWKSGPFRGGYPSPVLTTINGEDHLIIALAGARAALDPATGEVRWKVTVDRQSAGIMCTPLWIAPDKVFFSAAYGGGSRLFKITAKDGQYTADELWHCRKMKIMHGTAARVGDVVFGSSGDFGPTFLSAVNLETGKILWRKRGFGKANLLYADGKFIILDEKGELALAKADAEGIEVLSQAKVLEQRSWTVPTLVGPRLYLRDYQTIMALDLSEAANRPSAAAAPSPLSSGQEVTR